MQVSVVVPAFNEEARIGRTIRELVSYFSSAQIPLELIVADDGSRDTTAEIVEGCSQARLVRLSQNRGKGAALRQGVQASSGELVFLVDADFPYSAEAFDRSIPVLAKGECEAAIGARDLPDSEVDPSYPRHRIYMGRTFSHLVNRVLPLGIFDTQCGFKGFGGDIVRKAMLYTNQEDYTLDIELLLILHLWGARISRIPVKLIRHHGSKIRTFSDSFRMLRSLFRIRHNWHSRNYPPDRPAPALEAVACPLCSSPHRRPLACIGAHRFNRCRKCRTVFQSPRLPADLLDGQYDGSYFSSEDIMTGYPDYRQREDLQLKTARWQWKEVDRVSGGRVLERVLDVGCGSSCFLRLACENQKRCWGVDLIDLGADPGIEFRRGNFLEVDLPRGFFDLIVFNDSFEHFADSRAVLQRCRELLRPGGILMINMPDPDSWVARFSRSSWISFKREHLILLPRRAGRRLFEQGSFRQLRRIGSWQAVDWPYLEPRLRRGFPLLTYLAGPLLRRVAAQGLWVPTSGSIWILEGP